ncbi:MAG: helicase-exonuclease AddAB subunit AddA [Cellulosilyticum sp.]|nr:helicase-exonuclease AddAB subunit AddA [Cellulosilyticum sp.]
MAWTQMQQAAIDQRHANILVSAAAGSGKTAVLTERVLNRIIGVDGEEPIELDRFLIVTFTSAAAQEMKERITHKISSVMNELADEPEKNEKMLMYLEHQMALVPQASISTIHSFCLKTIKAYFNRLDIDPNIKVGNEAELSMMRSEILDELMESYLDEENQAFLELAEVYGSVQGLEDLKALILDIDTFSKSTPFPKVWLKEQVEKLQTPYASINEMPWAGSFKLQIQNTVSDLKKIYEKALELCLCNSGPELYKEAIESDMAYLAQVKEEMPLDEMIAAINGICFMAFSRKKQECDPDLKDQVKGYRDLAKEVIKGLQEDLAYVKDEKLLKQLPYVGHLMGTLVEVIETFELRYSEAKQAASVVDYNDLEHLCLELLIEPIFDEKGRVQDVAYTEVAKELSQFYEEVYIDEYQDSNTVQENLLKAVAEAAEVDRPTRFMVGDMKQSIYRFRLANPLIFAEKYQAWEKHQGDQPSEAIDVCIDLSQNFRSRENILEGVNDLFEQVMSPAVGELEYDDYAKLKVGNHYLDGNPEDLEEGALSDAIELHILETKEKDVDDEEDENSLEALKDVEYEALMVAELIHKLLSGQGNPTHIFDKDLGQYRKVEAKDIVILLRAPSNKASIFENALMSKGIGAYADISNNFFEAIEIQTIMSLLKMIDNPLQDIPVITVLRSPMVGISFDELVYIRKAAEEGCFYEALKVYVENLEETHVLKQFMERFENYREDSSELKTEELIARLYTETGYYRYVSMLPTGAKKKANLDLFKKYAAEYEANNHGKLFGFLQYLDKLSQTSEGLKEAKLVGDNENLVQIMSIHKSKGLEFSVVFLCDASKKFNNADLRKSVLVHSELGLAPDFVDTEGYVKYPTLPKLAMKQQIRMENTSEEMRVLYVALTRAKEKLFITGTVPQLEDRINTWRMFANRDQKAIMPLGVKRGGSYLNWIGMSLYANQSLDTFREVVGDRPSYLFEGKSKWQVKVWHKEELGALKEEQQVAVSDKRVLLENWDSSVAYSEFKEEINRRLSYQYAHNEAVLLPTKVSVSEIKRKSQTQSDDYADVQLFEYHDATDEIFEQALEVPVPSFIKSKEVLEGARRGTLIHSIFEHLDYLKVQDEAAIRLEIERLILEKKLEPEVLSVINPKTLVAMSQSDVVEKMRRAEHFEKEKAFIYLAPASLVDPSYPEDEEILIQGVIDAYFIDEEGITVVDYKTDYVDLKNIEASKEKIRIRYQKQLAFYAMALEGITKISVAHQYIYLYNINEWMHL